MNNFARDEEELAKWLEETFIKLECNVKGDPFEQWLLLARELLNSKYLEAAICRIAIINAAKIVAKATEESINEVKHEEKEGQAKEG